MTAQFRRAPSALAGLLALVVGVTAALGPGSAGVVAAMASAVPMVSIAGPAAPHSEPTGSTPNAATFTVTLSTRPAAGQQVAVQYTTRHGTAREGTAQAGANSCPAPDATGPFDYLAAAGSLVFRPTDPLSRTVAVRVCGDAVDEGPETFGVELTAAAGGALDEEHKFAAATIADNDGPLVSIEGPAAPVAETAGVALFRLRLKNAQGQPTTSPETITVALKTHDGPAAGTDVGSAKGAAPSVTTCPADGSADYLSLPNGAATGKATITAGTPTDDDQNPVLVGVTLCDDALAETPERLTVEILAAGTVGAAPDPRAKSAVATIASEDKPLIQIFGTDKDNPFRTAVPEPSTGQASASFTIKVTPNPSGPVQVRYETVPGTARQADDPTNKAGCPTNNDPDNPVDYVRRAETLTFPKGPAAHSKMIPVPVCGDALDESTENFTVTISSPDGSGSPDPGHTVATGRIGDTDGPLVSIEDPGSLIAEGAGPAVFRLRLKNDQGQPTTSPEDIVVTLKTRDGPADGDFAAARGTAPPSVTACPGNGSADYVSLPNAAADGKVTIPANTDTAAYPVPVPVTLCNDAVAEAAKRFTVEIAAAAGATPDPRARSATAIIISEDKPVVAIFGIDRDDNTRTTVTEPGSGTTAASFIIKVGRHPDPVLVAWGTVGGTAHEAPDTTNRATACPAPDAEGPFDYISRRGSVTFPRSDVEQTRTVSVPVCADTAYEASETVRVGIEIDPNAILDPAHAIATARIKDTDQPVVYLDPLTKSTREGNDPTTPVELFVRLKDAAGNSAAAREDITVVFKTGPGTTNPATPGADFVAVTPGSHESKAIIPQGFRGSTLIVYVKRDAIVEGPETFTVELVSASGATVDAAKKKAVVTIQADNIP